MRNPLDGGLESVARDNTAAAHNAALLGERAALDVDDDQRLVEHLEAKRTSVEGDVEGLSRHEKAEYLKSYWDTSPCHWSGTTSKPRGER